MTIRRARAFAMVEVVMATAIVGGMAVAALTLVGSVSKQKADAANLARGQALCRSLAEEIATRPVNDWSAKNTGLDIDINIAGINLNIGGGDAKNYAPTGRTGNRSGFTKVDDYTGYTESPPKDEAGTALTGYSGWTRSVEIRVADFDDPSSNDNKESGIRRITITTSYGGKTIATTTFLRSSEWERVMP